MFNDNELMENLMLDTKTFNPFIVDDNDFVVTFQKANDPTQVRTVKGNLFGPDKGATLSYDARLAYLDTLSNKELIKVYDLDDKRWKSFYTTKIINLQTL